MPSTWRPRMLHRARDGTTRQPGMSALRVADQLADISRRRRAERLHGRRENDSVELNVLMLCGADRTGAEAPGTQRQTGDNSFERGGTDLPHPSAIANLELAHLVRQASLGLGSG